MKKIKPLIFILIVTIISSICTANFTVAAQNAIIEAKTIYDLETNKLELQVHIPEGAKIAATSMTVKYDKNVLSVCEEDNSDKFGIVKGDYPTENGQFIDNTKATDDAVKIVYVTLTPNENAGILFTVYFNVKEGATATANSAILEVADLFNIDEQAIPFEVENSYQFKSEAGAKNEGTSNIFISILIIAVVAVVVIGIVTTLIVIFVLKKKKTNNTNQLQ